MNKRIAKIEWKAERKRKREANELVSKSETESLDKEEEETVSFPNVSSNSGESEANEGRPH